ncbi:MAG TPA: SRPBCC family protein [Caulobacteraceae bacterium]|nr:SRPBCC family protein [Caulobacteraceae bacterium]
MSLEVSTTRRAVLPTGLESAFDFIVAEDVLPKILTGYGPLPAIVGTSEVTGPWDEPGSQRIIHMADGGTVREQVTQIERPRHFAYRVWDFSNPLVAALSSGARGEWWFEPHAGGTHVTWRYTFVARSRLAALPLRLIVALLWSGFMDVCLKNSARRLSPAA